MILDDRIKNLLLNGSVPQRVEICRREPLYFALYYFTEYFTHQIPPFHFDLYQDCKDLLSGKIDEAAWIIFRDGAKTSIAKTALITHAICYKEKQYINVDSYDKGNAEQILFDVTVALQTNPKIIHDFGQLYFKKPEKDALSEAKMKRISSFITENDIKVEAFSTQESTRGRLFRNIRPDLYVIDDFENNKTKDSYPVIFKIKAHIDELKGGLNAGQGVLYLGNYITEAGAVEYVMEAVKRNPRGVLRLVNAINKDGQPSWPAKHTLTDKEAMDYNKDIKDPRKWKVSLEAKRASLGPAVFESEMMNNPAHGGDKVFDRDTIEDLIKRFGRAPFKNIAGFKIWHDYNPSHRYAIGADTAKGIGKDANASVVIDFSTIPNRVVATYKNNLMAPDVFGFELKRQGEMFGLPLIAPEINNTGYATVTTLKKIYKNIFVGLKDEKVKTPVNDDFGWDTNNATKPEMIYQLKRAIEDGLLVTYDIDLLNEMKYYSQKDINTMKLVDGMTRHYDLLIAAAITWMMRSYAKIPNTQRKPLIQTAHKPMADEYGG